MSKRKIESLDEPMLGLATTRQLLAEITARIEVDGQLDYRTVDCDEPAAPADDPLVCSECGCSSYSSSADRALVWCSFCGQDVKPIPRSEYEARQKPKHPDPPEGVENPVVCGVYWSPVCRRFVFEFDAGIGIAKSRTPSTNPVVSTAPKSPSAGSASAGRKET